MIATDEEYDRRRRDGDIHYLNTEVCDYEGGYAEGKIVPLSFLEEVADHGSEPARAAFAGNQILYSRIPDLEVLLERATAYPEAERIPKIQSFYAHFLIYYWYLGEAIRWDDRYLLTHATANFTLFAGRLILAHNRMLYPYHKWFMSELRRAPERPDDLIECLEAVLERPCKENADALLGSVANFREWEKPATDVATQFMEDSEWNWRDGLAPIGDR
ncbi:MAG: hypothetical protein GY725_22170 [bacterium]|nr:hypothetical protein [bacterium]